LELGTGKGKIPGKRHTTEQTLFGKGMWDWPIARKPPTTMKPAQDLTCRERV
jgi:hypothetical protein